MYTDLEISLKPVKLLEGSCLLKEFLYTFYILVYFIYYILYIVYFIYYVLYTILYTCIISLVNLAQSPFHQV